MSNRTRSDLGKYKTQLDDYCQHARKHAEEAKIRAEEAAIRALNATDRLKEAIRLEARNDQNTRQLINQHWRILPS